MSYIIDTHAHYDDKRFDSVRESVINQVLSTGYIKNIINAGCDISSSEFSLELAHKYPEFYATCGIHPHECGKIEDKYAILNKLKQLLYDEKAVALGEIGLDYHYDFSDRKTQMEWFDLQMCLAEDLNIPVVIHDREAHGDCMDIVRAHPNVKGEFHSFSGSAEMASELVRLGWYISFSGVITFKNASKILDALKTVPDDRIMIETDSPYLAPVPMRGHDNNSAYIKYTAESAAKLRGVTFDEFCCMTTENAKKFFNLKD